MIVSVEFFVNRSASDAEVRAQIDHLAACFEQRNGKFRGNPVGQSEEDELRLASKGFRVRLTERELARGRDVGEAGKYARQGLPGVLSRGYRAQANARMREKQPHQFFARVARGANDRYCFIIHVLL